ncbi:sulfatase [Paenibacillus cymbidii]|uniref:sulfatase n=1 Tax=Paenibacillus cymbidii TaxID=1639034 RepID=UPI001A9B0C64|nr:sulfatase [Paenibacillus cymbidii]
MNTRKPNIVMLLIDDLGWKDVGFMGSTYYETPHMDRLAADGMTFGSAYACPNCAPSRASLMTGLYSPRHGIYTVGSAERGPAHKRKLIPPANRGILGVEHATIAERLKAAGYACGHIGKWHLGEGPATGPEGRGFDLNVGGIHKGQPPAGYFSPFHIATLPDGPENEYLTDRLTNEALRFIDDHAEQPFFLYFAHYAVHKPLQAKPEMIAKYERKEASQGQDNPVYAAMIESTDDSVGRIVGKLDQLGLADHTIVLLVSDNGGLGGYGAEGLGAHDVTSQLPLRGGKGMLYEGGIRVPMAVKWPQRIEPGTTCDTPVMVIDFLPTILEAAGVSEPAAPADGESLLPLLEQNGGLARDTLFWHFPVYLEDGAGNWRTRPGAALRHGDWKLIEWFETGCLELYRLTDDIGERHNLAGELPDLARELHERMQRWREAVHAPVPTEWNPAYAPESADSI